MRFEQSLEHQLELLDFDYGKVIQQIKARELKGPLTVEEVGLMGISQFRLGLFREAKQSLGYAADHGNTECAIELCGCRFALFEFTEALETLHLLRSDCHGFLHGMVLRWTAILECFMGNATYGVGLLTRAYREFQAVGNKRGMQIAANMLGATLLLSGDYQKAEYYIKHSFDLSDPSKEQALWVDTSLKLFMVYAYTDRVAEAGRTLHEMRRYVAHVSNRASSYFGLTLKLCETVMSRLTGNRLTFATNLVKLQMILSDKSQRHVEGLVWVGPLLLDSISKMGQHGIAHKLIDKMLPDPSLRPTSVRIIEAVIWLRKGGYIAAINKLEQTLEAAREGGQRLEVIRCHLYLADAFYKAGAPALAVPHLAEGLSALIRWGGNFIVYDDLDTMKSVLLYGQSQPETAELLRVIRGKAPAPPQDQALYLRTLGRMEIKGKGQAMKWRLDEREVLLILAYLTLRPNETIEQIAESALSEKWLESPETAKVYVRQVIMLLRQQFGKDQLLASQERKNTPARYRLSDNLNLKLDVDAAYEALARGDLEGMFELYQGPFAARSDSAFAREVNDKLEGAVYQALLSAANAAQDAEAFATVGRWVRQMISLVPENPEVAELARRLDKQLAPLAEASGALDKII
ncbi:hypothetical protein V3W47_08565 [Deinococcus sp. YIM 134068]|uniref:hypothetical protein n=1 Tax=Deinococcus lichenicola TaxID=3118910 RepID=UPI002F91CD18